MSEKIQDVDLLGCRNIGYLNSQTNVGLGVPSVRENVELLGCRIIGMTAVVRSKIGKASAQEYKK